MIKIPIGNDIVQILSTEILFDFRNELKLDKENAVQAAQAAQRLTNAL